MNTQQAYNQWAAQYDTNLNRTRDLEGKALREVLSQISIDQCLEIGCGTGKNTEWLIKRAKHINAVDLSENMLAKAREKIASGNVRFLQADITKPWSFGAETYDLVTFSLVLEHIRDLEFVFKETAAVLKTGGYVYIGELHPFKQYSGSKARFETEQGLQVVECFNHHVSDFIQGAKRYGLMTVEMDEYFDDDNRNEVPRILTLLLRKK
ncbi:MAG TPA: class I SAM-dependent methyltransferase [Chryseolinea sp.]